MFFELENTFKLLLLFILLLIIKISFIHYLMRLLKYFHQLLKLYYLNFYLNIILFYQLLFPQLVKLNQETIMFEFLMHYLLQFILQFKFYLRLTSIFLYYPVLIMKLPYSLIIAIYLKLQLLLIIPYSIRDNWSLFLFFKSDFHLLELINIIWSNLNKIILLKISLK